MPVSARWNEIPKNVCCQCLSPQRECQLPPASPEESPRSATQVPFRLLPLHWDLECVRFYTCPLIAVSISYSPPALLNISPGGFQSQMFWGLIFLVQGPGLGSPMQGSLSPFAPWGVLPLLPISLWFLCFIFSCRKSFLLVSWLFS